MSEELQSQIGRLLAELAEQLGVAVEVMWAALIKQAYVEFVIWIVGILFTAALWVATKKLHAAVEKGYESPSAGELMVAITGVIALALSIGLIAAGYDAITGLLNPEYWALKEILSALK